MIGIYKIVNKKNGKLYIGSSKFLEDRRSTHFSLLRSGKHHSKHLQRAWDKESRPEKVFIFSIIEQCKEEELLEKENYYLNELCKSKEYIDGLNTDFLKISYNIKPHAVKGFYGKHSQETIEKLKLCSPLRRDILCFDVNGNFVKLFNSSYEAENELGMSNTSILKLCNTKRYVGKMGYAFGFKNDDCFIKFINNSTKPLQSRIWNRGRKLNKDEIVNSKKLKVTDTKDGTIYYFDSQREACKFFKMQPCSLNRCLRAGRPHRRGLLFEYYDIV